ncbi:hypothetical protein BDB00DRAFT_292829 [Zychaea mexicana]|uniref:uncharacterized protein n=1 Tax=Zychaea mexicana TaxID=64656 RepID=UPI0022FE165C|nr:uncharacterized protein BDB00DRAFT_292829 [Zychaea mexicana]KAI9494834.1 hypothetical protein BDB00DRAFT_292829 [Zychaea mexicana]
MRLIDEFCVRTLSPTFTSSHDSVHRPSKLACPRRGPVHCRPSISSFQGSPSLRATVIASIMAGSSYSPQQQRRTLYDNYYLVPGIWPTSLPQQEDNNGPSMELVVDDSSVVSPIPGEKFVKLSGEQCERSLGFKDSTLSRKRKRPNTSPDDDSLVQRCRNEIDEAGYLNRFLWDQYRKRSLMELFLFVIAFAYHHHCFCPVLPSHYPLH